MTIGDKIKRKRQELNYSQEKLAKLLGVTWKTVYRWEKDIAVPRHDMLKKLSKIFGVPPGWFISDKWLEPGEKVTVLDPSILEIPPDVLEILKDKRMQETVRILAPFLENRLRLQKIVKLVKLILDEIEHD